MAYSKHTWTTREPITQEKMNHIEDGIFQNDYEISQTKSTLSSVQGTVSTLDNTVSSYGAAINKAQQDATLALQGNEQGIKAWTQLQGAITTDPTTGTITQSLDDRLDEISSQAGNAITNVGNLQTEVEQARGLLTFYGNNNTAPFLKNKIDDIVAQVSNNRSGIGSILTDYSNAKTSPSHTYNSLQERLNTADTNFNTLQEEVHDAYNSTTYGNYESLDARLEADEAKISAMNSDKLNASDIIDNLTSTSTDKALSANQGRVLKAIIGNYSTDNTVQNAIATAETNANNYADTNKVDKTDVANNLTTTDEGKVLDARQGKILNENINTVAAEVEAARTSTVIRTPGENEGDPDIDTTYGSLDARLEAIEADKAAIAAELEATHSNEYSSLNARLGAIEAQAESARTDIDTIAGELSMVDSDSIVDTNSRIDTLENDLRTMAAELDMLDGTAIVDTNTRIDGIANEIEAAHRTLESGTDTLDNRFDAIEARATNLETTIGELQTADIDLDTRLDAIDGGEVLTGASTLVNRVATAESNLSTAAGKITTLERKVTALETAPKSATVVIEEDRITYNETTGTPTIYTNSTKQTVDTPSTDVDYLLQNGDKYYYWKYIQTGANTYEWALISGGGSGSGNTSGYDMAAEEYDALEEHTENTDYYVTRINGIHHYRWILDSNNVLQEVEIGNLIDTNNIKRYNATTSVTGEGDEQLTYLDLYEFDYGIDNTIIDPQASTLRAHILLPKGGSGSTTNNITARLVRIGNETIQTITNSNVNLYVFFSAWDQDQSYSGEYTVKYNNSVIKTDIFTSGDRNATPINWIVVENPLFENDIPVIQSPDTSKLYIVKVGNTYTQWAYNGNSWSSISDAPAGFYAIDISDYCKNASINNTVSITVNYGTGTTPLGKTWKVNIYELDIKSNAPDTLLISNIESYDFQYTPFGALNKILHIIIDNDITHETTINLASTTSGRSSYYTIPPQTHGKHTIDMYLSAEVGGVNQTTNHIIREYIWYDVNNTDTPVILASPLNGQTLDIQQYSVVTIPYEVYKKGANNITVNYYLNDSTSIGQEILEDTTSGKLSYLVTEDNAHKLTITVDNISIFVNLNVTPLDINVSPVAGAIIDFDPTSYTNNSVNRLPSWTVGSNTYQLTASDNFNWSNDINGGGYKEEEDGKAFVIKAGSYIDLNYPMFAGTSGNNVLTNGAEMKIIFKVDAVRDAEAVWFQNTGTLYEKDIGIQLGAHSGWLKTTKAVNDSVVIEPDENGVITLNGMTYNTWQPLTAYNIDDIVVIWDETDEDNHELIYKCIAPWPNTETSFLNSKGKVQTDYWLSIGKINTNIAATDSYLYLPYSEQDKIELDININKYSSTSSTNFIMSYEDGVPSKVYAYSYGAGGDGLYHSNTIRIGSDDCDVYLYHLRIYNRPLNTNDILQNFIADGRDIDEKVTRYNRNCIYWDSTQEKYFTSPSGNAVLDPIKLAEVIPDVKVLMLDTPIFTTSKKDFIQNSTLRCIHAEGGNVYTSRGDEDNWLFTNGFHSGQGTTSDNYGQSARNVDFLFEVDGINYPTKSKNMGTYKPENYPNYISKVYIGKDASTWDGSKWEPARAAEDIEICDDWKGDKCKISLTNTSVPNNYFNLKVNVASSENVNNALFQKRYDEFLVYKAPSQAAQIAKHRAAYAALGLNPDDIKIKNSMEFVPAVLFVRENDPVLTKHTEFNDTNWHFYALGNIGDSKKTDYTRAYDPDDMNEFTCENSDNNTDNGQFQSGVFEFNGHEAIETNYPAWSQDTAYETNDIVVYNGLVYQRTGATQQNGTTWVASDWSVISYTGWTDSEQPYFAPRTNPNPMDYIYPITSSQWNVQFNNTYLNRKHQTLVEQEFDGDHSFEFRYACCGDYRDGDLINETEGQDDDTQFNLNHDVVLAFYEWLITATNEQFIQEAEQWIVKSAMEFFYAYTHYYTMMDNRAKNTFWHFAKTGVYYEASRPVAALLHVYEESTDNGATWHKATGTTIDPNKKYRTQYAFDLWAYDMDTAVGIDNNGELAFPYGKEDGDYRIDNVPTSGYAFNGAGSIFWRRLKTTFADEIADVMNEAQACFNSEDLIQEFDQFQNCFPEEIWRLDIERKYIRTFTGASVDNSIQTGKQNPRFLTSMMQGRKKYQRRQWIRNQGLYFNSKYRLKDIVVDSNTVEFNIITPSNTQNLAVTPNYDLKLTPYQDMYLNVTIGNGGPTPSIRAKAGKTYTIPMAEYSSGTFAETRIYIRGFKGISGIGNLAPMYPYKFTLNALDRLKVLDIGTENSGYVNANLTALPFAENSNLPLLETLNIKNCHSLGGSLALNQASNLQTIEATGTSITGVTLPQYTHIKTLHLPSSITDLNLYSAKQLTDLQIVNSNGEIDYSGLYNLYIYDSDYSTNIDWIDIATNMLTKESLDLDISLLRLSTASVGDIQELAVFNNFKPTLEAAGGTLDLSGTINVTGSWSEIEAKEYANTTNVQTYDSATDTYNTTQIITSTTGTWPDLTLNARGTKTTKYAITYKYDSYVDDEGNTVEGDVITTLYIASGVRIPDIYNTGVIEMPTRNSTVRNNYTFGERSFGNYIVNSGWKAENSDATSYFTTMPLATSNMIIETHFHSEVRRYPVKWYMHRNDLDSLVKTSSSNVEYGSGENLEAPTIPEIHAAGQVTYTISITNDIATYSIFTGWETLPINIHPSATDDAYNIYATWKTETVSLGDLFTDTSNLTPEQLLVYSHMNSTQRNNYANNTKVGAGQRITYTLGQDSIETGITLVDPNNILRFDLNTSLAPIKTNIQPMTATNNEFTIMIDYSFNPDAVYDNTDNAGILMSCYYQNSLTNVINGFALYNNLNSNLGSLGPRVGFGDMFNSSAYSVSVGANGGSNYNTRNVVVLRHPKNSEVLYVYSGFTGNNHINSSVNVQTITWNNSTSNAYINFGQLTDDDNSEYDNLKDVLPKAKGTIYQAKYWNKDLGVGECKRLAAWPHELITFGITKITNTISTGSPADTSSVPAIGLTTLTTSNHGLFAEDTTAIGWGSSTYNTIVNNGVILGLPTKLQAILSKPSIKYLTLTTTTINGMDIKTLSANASSQRNYLYFPSVVNIDSSTNSKYEQEITKVDYETAPFPWVNGANVTVYEYNPTADGHWNEVSDSNASRYMNLRFPMKPINNAIRIFRETSSTFSTGSSTNIYHEIIEKFAIITGDIFIDINGHAYMYVSDNDVMSLGIQVQPATGIFTAETGGWVSSIGFWTRSMMEADAYSSYSNANHFVYSSQTGVVVTSYSSSAAAPSSGLGLNYSISI